jgi:hypothetical protein
VGAADFLEVLEDAAFELVDALVADVLHVDRGFFAADAAGAEGDHGLALKSPLCFGDHFGNSVNFLMR